MGDVGLGDDLPVSQVLTVQVLRWVRCMVLHWYDGVSSTIKIKYLCEKNTDTFSDRHRCWLYSCDASGSGGVYPS